ncbi:MAG: hypothetical protein LLF92_10215 [Planctomycetaceae bacterium]|nr:hypothetical protein [Planctomycetaceae bacterium]
MKINKYIIITSLALCEILFCSGCADSNDVPDTFVDGTTFFQTSIKLVDINGTPLVNMNTFLTFYPKETPQKIDQSKIAPTNETGFVQLKANANWGYSYNSKQEHDSGPPDMKPRIAYLWYQDSKNNWQKMELNIKPTQITSKKDASHIDLGTVCIGTNLK